MCDSKGYKVYFIGFRVAVFFYAVSTTSDNKRSQKLAIFFPKTFWENPSGGLPTILIITFALSTGSDIRVWTLMNNCFVKFYLFDVNHTYIVANPH